MPFLLRVELVDDERGNRVEGFEIHFDSREMAYGLLTLVKKNAAYSGREVGELGAPVDVSKVRSRLLDRIGKRPEGIATPGSGGATAPAGTSSEDAPRGKRSALWIKK